MSVIPGVATALLVDDGLGQEVDPGEGEGGDEADDDERCYHPDLGPEPPERIGPHALAFLTRPNSRGRVKRSIRGVATFISRIE